MPAYPGAEPLLAEVYDSVCFAVWDTNDSTDRVLAYFEDAFAKSPWSVETVHPTEENGSAWLRFGRRGIREGLVGIGPVEGANAIVLYVWFDESNSSE